MLLPTERLRTHGHDDTKGKNLNTVSCLVYRTSTSTLLHPLPPSRHIPILCQLSKQELFLATVTIFSKCRFVKSFGFPLRTFSAAGNRVQGAKTGAVRGSFSRCRSTRWTTKNFVPENEEIRKNLEIKFC